MNEKERERAREKSDRFHISSDEIMPKSKLYKRECVCVCDVRILCVFVALSRRMSFVPFVCHTHTCKHKTPFAWTKY